MDAQQNGATSLEDLARRLEALERETAYMFRPAFREYIAKNFPKPAPAPVAAAS